MTQAIYQLNGILPTDKYVPGQYVWTVPMQLTEAVLTCRPPSAGTLAVILEVGGVLKTFRFTIGAGGGGEVRLTRLVNALVPANTVVRWKASFSGMPEEAAVELAITMNVVPQSVSQVAFAAPKLTVQWANGRERLTLFNYNVLTHGFTEATPGISAGRAGVVKNGTTSLGVFIGATELLIVAGGILFAPTFAARGGVVSLLSPRLSFCVDNVPIATLAADALRVVELTEGTPAVLTSDDLDFFSRFEFYSAGGLTAVLNANGLTSVNLQEL